ncbi:MAG: tryptophan synthase subunit alpha [Desulfuromonadaceae bacterium]|nr:tryptophan synthase subunit alpha [Desulfuromonas sp.]MDY0184779.1 tryptophan synthase subunit alpha [Desulfuromonadaceae bacterium]
MGRIETTFDKLRQQGRVGLIPFITAGDPDIDTTLEIMHALVAAGADAIELGTPFSDPAADGPTIQAASQRALNAGATLDKVLDMVERFRQGSDSQEALGRDPDTPVVLMGYYNPVFVYGVERFAARAAQAGVDGVLLVDVPFEHQSEVKQYLEPHSVHAITLIAPTTPEARAAQMLSNAKGFVYYVSITGVTGTTAIDTGSIAQMVNRVRSISPIPVAVGFGVATVADAREVATFADAVIVGSALVKIIHENTGTPELLPRVSAFMQELKQGIRQAENHQNNI